MCGEPKKRQSDNVYRIDRIFRLVAVSVIGRLRLLLLR